MVELHSEQDLHSYAHFRGGIYHAHTTPNLPPAGLMEVVSDCVIKRELIIRDTLPETPSRAPRAPNEPRV